MSKTILPEAPKAAHTPGPWFVDEFNNLDYWFVCQPRGDESDFVAQVYKCMEEGDGKSNANLIAAAPDLLRENEIAIGHLRPIIRALEEWPDDAYAQEADELAHDLKVIRNNLENVARKAQGDNQ